MRQGSKDGDQLEVVEEAWTEDHEGLDHSSASQTLGHQNPLEDPIPRVSSSGEDS